MTREGVWRRITGHLLPMVCFVGLAALFLWPALFSERALFPTDLLMQMSPWAESGPTTAPESNRLPWNPLLWDSLAQFYPWREFAAHWMRRGVIPLWDPHQFCGTPFLGNSQSAVLYPLHFLFLYLPIGLSVARAMALLAATHLTLAGFLCYLWLRALRLSPFAATLGGVTFMLSGFAVTWLELPSFLTVACWLPLLFLTVHRVLESPSLSRAAGVAAAVGLVLLGGHLQIAFYCLLGVGVYVVVYTLGSGAGESAHARDVPNSAEGSDSNEQQAPAGPGERNQMKPGRRLLMTLATPVAAGTLGAMLAAPQLLPSMELSRLSHRVSTASAEGYAAYLRSAMPVGHLIRLFLPEFYGNPTRGDYVVGSPADYTEFAGYTGGVGVLLGLVGLLAWRRRPGATLPAVALGLVSLLLALGTPLNWLFYFGIPGFSQSGSPARVLVLLCFAAAWLAGLGVQALLDAGGTVPAAGVPEGQPNKAQTFMPGREAPASPGPGGTAEGPQRVLHAYPEGARSLRLSATAVGLWLLLLVATLAMAMAWMPRLGLDFSQLLATNSAALGRVTLFALLALALPLALKRLGETGAISMRLAERLGRAGLASVLIGELWMLGVGFVPLGRLADLYPATPLTTALKDGPAAGEGRVLPINRRWSLFRHPRAVLPPNSGLAMGLSDAQGYDSLFLGSYKGLANLIARPLNDSAPPENGNILFVPTPSSLLLPLLAADRLIERTPPSGAFGTPPPEAESISWPVLFQQGDVRVRRYPHALPRAFVARRWRQAPQSETAAADELLSLATADRLARTVLVSEPLPNSVAAGRGGPVRVREEGPNRLRLEVSEGTGPGTLVVLDNIAPGWRATDSQTGTRLPLVRANLTFRAVPLTRSGQSVTMRYEPASFRLGLYLAHGAVCILLALLVCSTRMEQD